MGSQQEKKTAVFLLLTVILLLVGSSLVWLRLSKEIMTTSSGAQPFYNGRTGQKVVALMFNVDWGEEYLPSILEILKENQAVASFMLTGRWAKLQPDLVRRIAVEGHEIGNHSYSHCHPNQLGRSELEEEIQRTQAIISEITGKLPQVFAPPYGEYNQRVLDTASTLGLPVIMWTLDTIDWRRPSASTIVERVTARVQPDCLILMHPTEPTVQALPHILTFLKEQGYNLVSVSDIIVEGGRVNQ
ncbi:MAG: polysaccharide deacetylase family protein [Bacillota bacterium]|jgi:probable sporulation protein (polysaccharide deacetylase family)